MLVGSGPEERSLRQQVEGLGMAGRVVFTGFVEHVLVPDYLAAADLLLFASRSEVQPLSALEAMAAGLPAVAVTCLATEELLTTGVDSILTDRDEPAFAAAVVRVLGDGRLRASLGEQARTTSQGYSVDATASKLEPAYRRLLDGYAVG